MTPTELKTVKWLANGLVGSSSKQMAMWIAFGEKCVGVPSPRDPADFDRCLLYLEAVPEARAGISSMGQLSPAWKALAARWDEVERCFLNEAGLRWSKRRSAEKTYELMDSIIGNRARDQGMAQL